MAKVRRHNYIYIIRTSYNKYYAEFFSGYEFPISWQFPSKYNDLLYKHKIGIINLEDENYGFVNDNLLLLNPKKIISNSRKKAWWICQKNPEHRYIMAVCNRIMHIKREKDRKGLRRKKEHFVQFEK